MNIAERNDSAFERCGTIRPEMPGCDQEDPEKREGRECDHDITLFDR
jgi:hypothetical protein